MIQGKTDAFWVGTFAGAIGHYLTGTLEERDLRSYYRDFLRSPVCDAGLRRQLPDLPTKTTRRGNHHA